MRDNELIKLLGDTLAAASAQAGWNYVVLQKDQPTQEGVPTDPAIFFEKLFDTPRGWPMTKLIYDPVGDVFVERDVKQYQTTFQISALVNQDPNNTSLPTASDVVDYMHRYIGSRFVIAQWIALGLNSFNVTEVRNPYFEDDRHRFEAHPSFDLVMTHEREIDFEVPAVHVVEGAVYPLVDPDHQGTFPIP